MRIAVVVPRYGQDILGGAESQARGFANEAVRRNWTVEMWTTCARSHYDWENVFPAGCAENEGMVVRRFPITHWEAGRRAELDVKLNAQGSLPVREQYAWLETGPHSAPLYLHAERHATEFDAVVALPYATPLVHYAACCAPDQTIVWPCLHNEAYAYMEPVRMLLESVYGVMFNSPEERDLAIRDISITPKRHGVLGEGVHLNPTGHTTADGHDPYILYMGRLEGGKNLTLLYEYVQRYWEEGGKIPLIVLGGGPLVPPDHPAFDYRGYVTEETKADLCARALFVCQPSLNESFSLTTMESWLAGRPVLVHADCAVTRGHVRRSKGGLWFRTYEEFAAAVDWLSANLRLANRLGADGREYVLHNYTWPAVLTRFKAMMRCWQLAD